MACLVLVMSFLVGCGALQATLTPLPEATLLPEPTDAPPEPTATQVEPTATPVPPTTTPTARPLTATPTTTQVFTLVTSAEEIIGTWYSGMYYIRFDRDETFRQARALDKLDNQPYSISSYQFEETRMVIAEVSVSGVPPCGKEIGSYEIRLVDSGNIQIVSIKDRCTHRAGDIARVYEPVR